ncbi:MULTISPECIES: amino acid permease [Thermocrispum]|nr:MULTISPECIES: amino acid permease [Thermocrispum]
MPNRGELQAEVPRKGRLKSRHVTLLAIGGCIGASLFVGVGEVVRSAGAGAVLSFFLGGVIVYFVMLMLGEMTTARPELGTFVDYARVGVGGWAAFAVGWLYWYLFVAIIAFEAVVAGQVIGGWLGVPNWLCSLGVMAVFVGLNLYSARGFGEAEFLLAGIKIATILVLGVGAVGYVLGLLPGSTGVGLTNLLNAPLLPNGIAPVVQGMAIAVLSFVGTEIAVIASRESEDPGRAVVRTTRLAVIRIVLFFVGSVVALLLVLPFAEIPVDSSPFAAAFDRFGIPYSVQIMDAVLLVAVLSIVNASIYACSQTLFRLARNGYAPAGIDRRNARGVPWIGVLLSGSGGLLGAAVNWFAPDEAFAFVLNSVGALALIVYGFVCASQVGMRMRTPAEQIAQLPVRMWGHPWLAILCGVALLGIDVVMFIEYETRVQVALSLLALVVVSVVYVFLSLARRRRVDSA